MILHLSGPRPGSLLSPKKSTESRRRRRVFEAKIARECHYDRKKFRQQVANS
jgi:hypothetical protein